MVTTDGTICDIPRSDYEPVEQRVIAELKNAGKPFIILLNSAVPDHPDTLKLRDELSEKYGVSTVAVNCLAMDTDDIKAVIETLLFEFPCLKSASISRLGHGAGRRA
jgi:stage IV sporulation protein A